MNTKLYIVDNIENKINPTGGQALTISATPSTSDMFSFSVYNNYPSIATYSTYTVDFSWFPIPSPYTNQQMAADIASYLSLTDSLGIEYEYFNEYFNIVPTNGSPVFGVTYSSSFMSAIGSVRIEEFTNYNKLDLYKDEAIQLTTKLSDIEKLSNIFTDFSNTFTLPATPNNNDIFKHYYDIDIYNTFNANIRVLAYIEIDTFIFRFGKIQLEGIDLKNGKPDSYKITFYGGLKQLTDLVGDDMLSKLDYKEDDLGKLTKTWDSLSKYDYDTTEANFVATLTDPTFKGGDIMTPLIEYSNRDWNYGTGDYTDIGNAAGPIRNSELYPALRIIRLIEGIEKKYNISFSRHFFGKAMFNNLFMWLNGKEVQTYTQIADLSTGNQYIAYNDMAPGLLPENYFTISATESSVSIDLPFGGFQSSNSQYEGVPGTEFYNSPLATQMTIDVYNTSSAVPTYNVIIKDFDTDEVIFTGPDQNGDQSGYCATLNINQYVDVAGLIQAVHKKYKIEIQTTETITCDLRVDLSISWDYVGSQYTAGMGNMNNHQSLQFGQNVSNSMPDMKVIDFLQGLMKMFKLIIRPITSSSFYINTMDGFYQDGKILDITDYVDNKSVSITRPYIYKTLEFTYNKTENVLGKKYRKTYDPDNDKIGYGDYKAVYNSVDDKNDLSVQFGFELMMFERLPNKLTVSDLVNFSIGQSCTLSGTTLSPNKSKAILFFNNGLADISANPIKVKFQSNTEITLNNIFQIGNSDDEQLSQVRNFLNFNSDIDGFHLTDIQFSLYNNFWRNWIETIYDLKQRKFAFDSNLPPRYVEELSLNDRIVIGDERYKINDYTVDLNTGATKLNLFKDIYDYTISPYPAFNGSTFSYTSAYGLYNVDFTTANEIGSYYLYGDFTTYAGETASHIIKLKDNGQIDHTFNAGSGPNSDPYSYNTITKFLDDSLFVCGNFTSYNGVARNRGVKLLRTGAIDTSWTYTSGFNNYVSSAKLNNTQTSLYVVGLFSSYNGTTSNRIVKLNATNGAIDTTFMSNVGTGFTGGNVTAVDIAVNADDSIWVTGYFAAYNGFSSNKIVKLTATGSVYPGFNPGTGLTTPAYTTNGVISSVDGGCFVYGNHTVYNGISTNHIVKLTATGSYDPNFTYVGVGGSGFNDVVEFGRTMDNGKLFFRGPFTTYNGIPTSNMVILNTDGTVYRAFNNPLGITYSQSVPYFVGQKIYSAAESDNLLVELTHNNNIWTNFTYFYSNAGKKYFGISLFVDQPYYLSYSGDFGLVTIDTENSDQSGEVVFNTEYNNTSTERNGQIGITSGNFTQYVTIKQYGLG